LLGRFVDVCQAVGYAHARGVLHRDLKPGNVMLGRYGETLVVDWGLAKPFGQTVDAPVSELPLRPRSSPDCLLTEVGHAVGTPAYMSPEQAAGRLDQLGPATDVYSLGATLYELLTGQPPFTTCDFDSVQKGTFPPPRQVKPQAPQALEAVCLKAMALRSQDRYPSALAMAADVEHWLADEPVSAWREPFGVRAWRWVRRHRTSVTGAVALLLTAVGALAVSTALIRQQERLTRAEKKRAEANFALARSAVDETVKRVVEDPKLKEAGLQATRRELLAAAVPFYERLVEQQRDDRRLEADRGRALGQLSRVRAEMGEIAEAVSDAERACQVFDQLARAYPRLGDIRQEQGLSWFHLGNLLAVRGSRSEAVAAWRQAQAIQHQAATDFPERPAVRQELALTHLSLGNHFAAAGQWEMAVKAYRQALLIQEDLTARSPQSQSVRQELALTHLSLGNALAESGDRAGAAAELRHALAIQEGLARQQTANRSVRQELALTHLNLGRLQEIAGNREEALESYRRAIEVQDGLVTEYPGVPAVRQEAALSHRHRGQLLAALGRREARTHLDRACDLLQGLVSQFPTVPSYAIDACRSYCAQGDLNHRNGDRVRATRAYSAAVDSLMPVIARDRHVAGVVETLQAARVRLAGVLAEQGNYEQAMALVDQLKQDGVNGFCREAARACALATMAAQSDVALANRYGTQAIELLRSAVVKDCAGIALIWNNPDFIALRRRADFADFLWDLAESAPPAAPAP
jgi:tetratricopeptide (TPR) repeat protein